MTLRMTPAVRSLTLIICAILLFAISGMAKAQEIERSKPQKLPQDQKNFVSLTDLVQVLETVLDQIQDHLKSVKSPPLQSAEFDFQTVTTNDTTGGLVISIVTAEGEHLRTTTKETDFTYSLPTGPTTRSIAGFKWMRDLIAGLGKTAKPEDFNKTLPAAILAAADTMSTVKSIGPLTHKQFSVTLTFSVSNSFNGGIDPSSLVVVAPELKYTHSKQNVQSLKLTFSDQ